MRSIADSRAALDNLVRLPAHKQGTVKFDPAKMQRTLSPLTFEDTDQFHNLNLISTLRSSKVGPKHLHIKTETSVDQNAEEASQADNALTTTIPMPPSFYEDDLEKKFKKYELALRDRQVFKQKFLKAQNLNISTISAIPNQPEGEGFAKEQQYTGGLLQPTKSEFQSVIKRRKSRMSVQSPTVVDFDHIGDHSKYEHIIKNKNQTKDVIQFNMNLRRYKNTTNFEGGESWQFPKLKGYSPKFQYLQVKDLMRNKNGETKFKPSVSEANANEILHLLPAKGTVSNYQTTAWQCGLRGDRDER